MRVPSLAKILLLAALVVFASFPHVYQLYLARGTSFGPDEGYQVAAAINLSKGLGYTYRVLSRDLSKPQQVHLQRWPPGYSVVLWGLHSLGLDWTQAILVFKTLVLVVGVAGWLWMACRVLGSTLLAAALIVWLPFRFIPNPTDMFCCALVPFFLLGLERLASRTSSNSRLVTVVGLSLLACLVVIFKYSAVYLVGVGFFWLVGICWISARSSVGLGRIAVYILPPLSLFVGLMSWHRSEASSPILVSGSGHPQHEFYFWSYFDNPFEALFIANFRLKGVFEWLGVTLAEIVPISAQSLYQILVTGFVVVMIGMLVYYARVVEAEYGQKVRLRLLLLCCLCAGAFLIAVSVKRQAGAFSHIFRYYLPIAPLLIMFYVRAACVLLRFPGFSYKILGVCILLISVVGTLWYVPRDYYATLKRDPIAFRESVAFLTRNIERISHGEPRIVVGVIPSFATAESLSIVDLRRSKFWKRAYTTRTIWLFVVQNTHETPWTLKYQRRVEELAARFSMEKLTHHGLELYFSKIEPGDDPSAQAGRSD